VSERAPNENIGSLPLRTGLCAARVNSTEP
jgi:hypothetical protein